MPSTAPNSKGKRTPEAFIFATVLMQSRSEKGSKQRLRHFSSNCACSIYIHMQGVLQLL
jgi:hypothetical protein